MTPVHNNSRQRPLMIHLALAASALADPHFKKNEKLDEDFWQKEEGRQVKASMEKVIDGIKKYQLHDFARARTRQAVVWQDGEARLFHYKSKLKTPKAKILAIPSMINGAEIMDLLPDRSLLKWLAGEGFDVYLLDWGNLKNDKELKSLDAAIGKKVKKILKWIEAQDDLPFVGFGYCMGGLLLAAADQLHEKYFDALCFVATPWDFKRDTEGNFAERVTNWAETGLVQTMHLDAMPAHWLQMIFAGVDPSLIARKFSAFADMDQTSEQAKLFVAVEDWVNGGADLPTATVQQTVGGWYQDNKPANGEWIVDKKTIDPKNISKPSYVIVPGRDKIVPPSSARPLGKKIKKAVMVEPDCGHISMMIGSHAERDVWMPLRDWIISHCSK